ncbi:MAG: hypothetical protein C0600_01495 [Ignavibacteria bacterium]|nr:MAG: hypothetical protein C0600_01495 [Ignavibacteria bacterium]
MSRYFMHFWSDELCDAHYQAGFSGEDLEFTAGAGFREAGVETGDVIYIISAYDGQFLLVGRMIVGSLLQSFEEAKVLLGDGVEKAEEYVIAALGTATEQFFTRQLRWEEVGDLRVVHEDGTAKPLKFAGDDAIDTAALEHVRELTAASAAILDEAIEQPFHEHPPEGGGDVDDEFEEDEIGDEDLAAIALSFADHEVNSRAQTAAREFVTRAFEEKGWTVMPVHDIGEGFDLHCAMENDHLHVVVRGTVHESLEFLLTEIEYARAEEDDSFALCLVTSALSGEPHLSTFSGDDLYHLFDARPLTWAFRFRGEDGGEKA